MTDKKLVNVGVAGTGTIGRGIAQLVLTTDRCVRLMNDRNGIWIEV